MNRNKKNRTMFLPALLVLAIVFGMFLNSLLYNGRKINPSLFMPETNKLEVILDLLNDDYVDTISKNKLIEQAIPAILKDLDPHTVYIPAEDLQNVNNELKGNFGGIGIQFFVYKDTVAVVKVISGGPSEKAGILSGDRIVMVDDTLIAGVKIKNAEIMDRLKGRSGTSVKVSIARKKEKELKHFNIVRGQIPVSSVDAAYMLDDKIGYVKISRFAANTFYEFSEKLEKLNKQKFKGLIVDLRSNQGGYLSEATNMINEFLPNKSLIVYTKGKAQPKTDYLSNGEGMYQEMPITVLIDEFSASASEIFAGAIQDNDRGKIVGRRSFGKGLVQEQRMLPDGSALRLTVSRYYTPVGRSIQKPYDNGKEDYYKDIHARLENNEFQEPDSTYFNDSLKYITPKGNVVYGGGGIMPDVFVPVDTIGYSEYLNHLIGKGLIYEFAFYYVDKYRKEMNSFKNYTEVLNYLNKKNIVEKFVAYVEENGEKYDEEGLKISREIIDIQLKAYIVRNLVGDEGFYPVFHKLDKTLKMAHQLMQ